MSLSAQYLEELSKRYKKQVDDMQKAFDRTLAIVTESSRQAVQREQIQAEKLSSLEQRFNILAEAAAVLLAERESWQYKFTVSGFICVGNLQSLIFWSLPGILSQHCGSLCGGLLHPASHQAEGHPHRQRNHSRSGPETFSLQTTPLCRRYALRRAHQEETQ